MRKCLIILMINVMAAGSAARDFWDNEKPPEARHFIRGDFGMAKAIGPEAYDKVFLSYSISYVYSVSHMVGLGLQWGRDYPEASDKDIFHDPVIYRNVRAGFDYLAPLAEIRIFQSKYILQRFLVGPGYYRLAGEWPEHLQVTSSGRIGIFMGCGFDLKFIRPLIVGLSAGLHSFQLAEKARHGLYTSLNLRAGFGFCF